MQVGRRAVSSWGLRNWLQHHLQPIPLLPSLSITFPGPKEGEFEAKWQLWKAKLPSFPSNLMENKATPSWPPSCAFFGTPWWREQGEKDRALRLYPEELWGRKTKSQKKCMRLGKKPLSAHSRKPSPELVALGERLGKCWQVEGTTWAEEQRDGSLAAFNN